MMRRWAPLVTLLMACGGEQPTLAAIISGGHDLVAAGDLLYVLSAHRSELRVLDLAADPRDFVRAPNPLQPLSVPVLHGATELESDVRFDGGDMVRGPYLYAITHGDRQVSIVVMDRGEGLKELVPANGRITTGAVITAIAGRGPPGGSGPSTLFLATNDGAMGRLYEVSLPPPSELAAATVTVGAPKLEQAEMVITTIAVLPDGFAFGARIKDGTAFRGAVFKNGVAAENEIGKAGFASAPGALTVPRLLVSHPATTGLAAGAVVVGAVDDGRAFVISAGATVSQLQVVSAPLTGLTVIPNGQISNPSGEGTVGGELIVVASAANGRIYFLKASASELVWPSGTEAYSVTPAHPDYSLHYPAAVTYSRPHERLFVSYLDAYFLSGEDADALIELTPQSLPRGGANSGNLKVYR